LVLIKHKIFYPLHYNYEVRIYYAKFNRKIVYVSKKIILIYLDIDEDIFSTSFSRDIPFIISDDYSQFMDELKGKWNTIFNQSNYNNQTKN